MRQRANRSGASFGEAIRVCILIAALQEQFKEIGASAQEAATKAADAVSKAAKPK